MITRLLSSKSLLNQFLVFNLMAFLILGFFTFLYLLAIEPELINKTSKKHQNIISNIESNLKIQKIQNNSNSPYAKFPDNFALHHIGMFDSSAGGILEFDPEHVINFSELTNKE